jgi:Protein of unknown function (DUF1604)
MSSSEDENAHEDEDVLCKYGVPLTPYEAGINSDSKRGFQWILIFVLILDEIPSKKPIQIEDQTVKRFHGAFTGGFSAGFWNTVGSENGEQTGLNVSNRVHLTVILFRIHADRVQELQTREGIHQDLPAV